MVSGAGSRLGAQQSGSVGTSIEQQYAELGVCAEDRGVSTSPKCRAGRTPRSVYKDDDQRGPSLSGRRAADQGLGDMPLGAGAKGRTTEGPGGRCRPVPRRGRWTEWTDQR